jgi:hypothetical protein
MVHKLTPNSNFSGTPTSQIELVQMQENYACDVDGCAAGYDGLHPNALGKIVQAY